MKKTHHLISCFAVLSLMLVGCTNELIYDPSIEGDAPGTQGSEWRCRTINLPEPFEQPFTVDDLSKTMSVGKLLDIALYNNPSTRSSWNAARAAAFGYHAALSVYYPTIDYIGTINAENSTIGLGTTTTNSIATGNSLSNIGVAANTAGTNISANALNPDIYTIFNELTMSYLLYDFGGRRGTVELARQTLFAANWEHNYTMQQVMLSVLNAYTSYLGNKGLVIAYEQDLSDAETALKASQLMFEAGVATFTDVLQAQSAVEQAKLNLITSIGNERTSLANILIALGLPPDTPLNIETLPDKLPVIEIAGNVSTLFELAKQRRPDLGAAIAAVKEQEANFLIAYSAGMPTFTANGVLSRLHFINNTKRDGHDNSISLTVNFPVFQGFFYINQERQVRAQIEEALANVDVQISTIATQVVSNYYLYETAAASLPTSEALLGYSKRAFQGLLMQYRMGTSSILDVLTALTTLSNARAQVVTTRTQWAASLANLAFSVGILQDSGGFWRDAPPKYLYKVPLNDTKSMDFR